MLRLSRPKNKTIPLLFSSLLSFFSAHAQEKPQMKELNQRLKSVEQAYKNAVNPNASLGYGPVIQGDVLFWQARETGLAYGIKTRSRGPLGVLPKDFRIKELEFEWDFGFRVGLGYAMKRDGWDIMANWTHLMTDAHDSGMLPREADKSFLPIWSDPTFAPAPLFRITEADAHWRLHYNLIDVGIGRAFYISKSFSLRPYLGPTGVRLNQRYRIDYEKVSLFLIRPPQKDDVKIKNKFDGIGAQLGCDVNFYLGRAFSIWGRASGSIYAGEFKISRKEIVDIFGEETFKTKQHIHAGRAATYASIGFNWQHAMAKNRYIHARVSYDLQYYFKQNQMPRIIDMSASPLLTFIADQGDLSLQGGSFSLTLGF